MSAMQFRTIESPVGPLTLAGNGRRLMHLWMVDQAHEPSHVGWERDDKQFSDALEQLDTYFAGERQNSISSLIWSERTSSGVSGKRC